MGGMPVWKAGPTLLAAAILCWAVPAWAAPAPPDPPECVAENLGGPPWLAQQFPTPWEGLRRLFLEGKCALAQGHLASAEAIFRRGLEQDKRLPNLWRFHLLRVLAVQGKNVDVLAAIAELLGGGRPAMQARLRQFLTDPTAGVAGSVAEFDNLATYLVHATPSLEDHDLLERLHALAFQRKDDALLRRLPALLWRMPKNEASARKWAAPGAASATDWVARQQRLTDLRLTKRVVEELESGGPIGAEPETARRLGRLYFSALLRERNYRHAAAQIQSEAVRRRFAFDEKEYLTTAIRIELRRQVIAPVLKWLERLETVAPRNDTLPAIYLELARYHAQRRDPGAMRPWCVRITREYPESWAAPDAYWLLTWNAYQAGDFAQAAAWSGQALENGAAFSADAQARFHYWRARSLERHGRQEDAAAARAALRERWPSSYYGLILDPRARQDPPPPRYSEAEFLPPADPLPALKEIWTVPELADAVFLRAVGEDEAAEALLRQVLQRSLPKEVVEELARLFHAAQAHYLQQRLIANHAAGEHVRRPVTDTPFWRQAYPPAFWELVRDEAGGQEVSPYFVLAIMREESRFQVDADSRAGAKGLMQLMPTTAKELARRERATLSEEALLTPELNIPLGVRYLRQVLHRFDWNPILAAAAYNAGPGAVTRWTRAWGQLPLDEFVEQIPYEETQNYVRRVYSSYLIYRRLYR